MRKSIKLVYIFALLLLISSCRKEKNVDVALNVQNFDTKIDVTVTPKGHLFFKTSNDIVKYGLAIKNSNTFDSLLSDLKEKGFKCRNQRTSINARESNSVYNLIFNEEGLVQVDDVIMKITSDDKFLYTLKEEYSNSETFDKLLAEIYDGLKMNKINVDRKLTEEFNFIDFTAENPFGKLESLYNETGKRPMFGTVTNNFTTTSYGYNVYGQCQQCTHSYTQTVTYVFWIGFPGEAQYVGTTCENSNTCD
jgi:hypothetical protein